MVCITETNLKILSPDQEDKLLHKFILNTDFKGEFFEEDLSSRKFKGLCFEAPSFKEI